MSNCTNDILAHHNENVTLSVPEQKNMRGRRDNIRDRLRGGLRSEKNPLPKEFITQGSYAMKTMVQDAANDYDIDDGVYFTQSSLKAPNEENKSAKDARQMVCNALADDERFSRGSEVKKNCVRVYYKAGYHVDLPIYRIRDDNGDYELASGSDWVHSRAADVEDWFKNANETKSPDENNGRQFCRLVRMLKKFARSRDSWKDQTTSGFAITILAEEKYVANLYREDTALHDTMRAIYNRLLFNLEVNHPVTPGAKVTKGPDDTKMKFFRDKLQIALNDLEVLDKSDCTREQALKAWDKVFNTDFFIGRYDGKEEGKCSENALFMSNLIATKSQPAETQKSGGGRFA